MVRGPRGISGLVLFAVLGGIASVDPALAGEIDLGTVGGINYRVRSNSAPISAPGVSTGPDAECLTGDKPVGGGVAIGGDAPEVAINWSSGGGPDLATPRSWVTVWTNISGAPKSATVMAACMDRRVERARRRSSVNGGSTKTLKASCPSGTHVASGGGFILGSNTADYLNSSYPFDDGDDGHEPDDGWKLRIRNGEMGDGDGMVEARCVEFHPSYRSARPVSIDDGATIDRRAGCPGGTHIVGGGLRLRGDAAEARPVTMTLEDDGDADGIPDDRYLARAGNSAGTDHKRMTVYAVCKS